jgi:ADP-ribosyl-[dinitrogen reductase] hydrolase
MDYSVPLPPLLDRYLGCLLGLAVGDALGVPLEFKPPGSFKPITDMIGGGPFHLQPGQWTDDTSMALCLAASLVEKSGFDPKDQMQRYLRWYKEGYMSSTGACFGIGKATRAALANFQKTGNPYSGSTEEHSAGNGSLMRLAPLPLFFAQNPEQAISLSGEGSRTTHAHPACVDACRYFAGLIVGALRGASKNEILSEKYCPVKQYWTQNRLHPDILTIADGGYKRKEPPLINGKGHVVRTLEAALWAFNSTASFEEGCLKVVNLGDDADTTGAVYGQIAGAFYGYNAIPSKWREKLARKDLLEDTARALFQAAADRVARTNSVRGA